MTTAKRMSSGELRSLFLKFFRERGHQIVPSSSLVPGNDPTLLFTNAGMVQFKDVFLGKDKRAYSRAASSQRCVRAGGKHNDLENVGYTARHHTFFEMLGNFSFGDYFKKDAIRFGWDFVTGKDWLGIDPNRLMVTIYHTDDEAFDIWHKDVGLPADRIVRIGDKPGGGSDDAAKSPSGDNFWQMGETGPCGPCTEIFYDHGAHIPGGPPGSPDADGDRWIEIWNLVFMQFDRSPDGVLSPLPKPSVDTGMGLERTAALMQGVHSNYEIDLFVNLIKAAAQATNTNDLQSSSLRVIADHIRATSFLIADGVLPSNEGRGYVLRRIMRRAIRHGYKLGQQQPFFYTLVGALAQEMGEAYPELKSQQRHVELVIKQEEERFAQTLFRGMVLLEQELRNVQGQQIPGDVVFRLYDTFGFPADMTADIARERGLTIDEAGFERAKEEQVVRSQEASKFGVDLRATVTLDG
jgi:alanyl-tRNA synthetase